MVRGDENPEGVYKLIKALRFDKRTWQDDARCRGAGNDPFFLGKGGSSKKAKDICEPCKVKVECRAYAIEYEEFGIWGGTTQDDREALVPIASRTTGARRK